jgi:hypothetical protein
VALVSTGAELAAAFLAGDVAAVAKLLAEDVTFHSPVTDYHGREQVTGVLALVTRVLGRGEASTVLEGSEETATFFTADVGGQPLDGVLRVIAPGGGPVSELTLMARPLPALLAAVEELRKAAR